MAYQTLFASHFKNLSNRIEIFDVGFGQVDSFKKKKKELKIAQIGSIYVNSKLAVFTIIKNYNKTQDHQILLLSFSNYNNCEFLLIYMFLLF